MLLPRSLPPHFLLPAWSTRQLRQALQRAHKSTDAAPEPQGPTIISKADDGGVKENNPKIRYHGSWKGADITARSGKARISCMKTKSRDEQGPKSTSNTLSEPTPPTTTVFSKKLHYKSPTWGRLLDRTEATKSTSSTKPLDAGLCPKSTSSSRSEFAEFTNSPSSEERYSKSTIGISPGRTVLAESVQTLLDDEPAAKRIPRESHEQPKRPTSLFDELFPEESQTAKQSEKKAVDKLPVFDWSAGPKIDWNETVEKAAKERNNWFRTIPTAPDHATANRNNKKDQLSVLVLSCASKTLEESDFFRLGSKGEHIEGWTSGIVKVIQGRDNTTLERLGHYFLVFSNEPAALAYLDQTRRLYRLSKVHAGGRSTVPLSTKYLLPGEDIKKLLRGFSLVPGQSILSLRLVSRPYTPAMEQVLANGGPAAVARQRTNSEDMVLLSVDRGRISHFDIQYAISRDGKRRNLPWNLIAGEKAIVKVNSDEQNPEIDEMEDSNAARSSRRRKNGGPARYIISFNDPHEARRFVREWHRRPLPVDREHKAGNEPPPITNVEMFW